MVDYNKTKNVLQIVQFGFLTILISAMTSYAEDWTSIGEPDCSPASECVYIRDGGTGDGSAWNNALDDLPATFTRGKKYYIADGTYGDHTFNTTISGSTYIFIKKATESDHGTETGWQSFYGDGVATFTGKLTFGTGSHYWVFDGQVGGGPSDWYGSTNAHGFKIVYSSGYRVQFGSPNPWSGAANYLKIYHTMWGAGAANSDAVIGITNYSTFAYCYFYQSNRTSLYMMGGSTKNIIEYTSFRNHNCTGAGTHNEPISWNDAGDNSNNIFRYNEFWNWKGSYGPTGVIVMKGDGEGVTNGDFKIYGNIFRCTDAYSCRVSNGIITDTGSSAGTINDIKVWNNTFYNTGTVELNNLVGYSHSGSGNEFRNNIVIEADSYGASGKKSNNLFDNYSAASQETDGQYWSSGEAALFTDAKNGNFLLKTAAHAGFDLSAEYTVDMIGNTYGAEGNWSRGAYAYTGNTIDKPSPPTGLKVLLNN